jgi:hypothetical protein
MIQLALHEDAYLDACKAYQEVWDTEEVKKDEAKSQEVGVLHFAPIFKLTDELFPFDRLPLIGYRVHHLVYHPLAL